MRRVVDYFGRALITVGVLILAFVAYQVWGTGLIAARDQSDLKAEFRHVLTEHGPLP